MGLSPNAVTTFIRFVFERCGKVRPIFVQPEDDVHSVKRTLHTYAERPLHVLGQEIIVSRECKSVRIRRAMIFVSDFLKTTQHCWRHWNRSESTSES